jgi:DNA repair exonuclease SbcCD ATPase subunit
MRIQYVKIKNLGPFKNVKLDLSDKDVIGVQGRWKGNSRRSNQSGKSFFMEAVKWCATGNSRADKDIELIHHGADYGEVEIGIGDKDDVTVIRRGKDIKNNSVLEIGNKDKSKEAQDTINKLIGFLPSEFDMTLFFKQEEINAFMDLKPQEKKKYIMQWLENHYWDDPYSRANRDYLSEQKHLDELKSNLTYLEDKFESMSHSLSDDLADKESALEGAKADLATLESKLKKLEKSIKNDSVDDLHEKIEDAKRTRKTLQRSLDSFKGAVDEIAVLEEKISKIKIVKPKYSEKELYEKMANARATISDLKSKLSSAENMTGRCPLLGEDCDRVKSSPKKIKE